MILYQEKPYRGINMRNILLLDDTTSGGVIYVSQNTYDQAKAILTRFDNQYGQAWKHCVAGKVTTADAVYPLAVEWKKTVPEPLNYLAFAFQYIKDAAGIEWESVSRRDMFGYMHELSMMIDFNACTLAPAEVRAQVIIPTTILKSYEESWKDLTEKLEDRVIVDYRPTESTRLVDMSVGQFKELLSTINLSANVSTQQSVQPTEQTHSTIKQVPKQESKPVTNTTTTSANTGKPAMTDKKEENAAPVKTLSFKDVMAQKAAEKEGITLEEYKARLAAAGKNASKSGSSSASQKPISRPIEKPTGGKDNINGTPVAQYDPDKAADTIDTLNSFADM